MSISGNLAICILRMIHPGKGGYSDYETCRARAQKENDRFVFSCPKNRKVTYWHLKNAPKPCLIMKPKSCRHAEKVVLYIYGGITNNWNTQKNMAARYAVDSGTEVWYPVYPSFTEAPVTDILSYLLRIYRTMLKRYSADHIAFCGVSMGGFYALQMVNFINHEKLALPMPGLVIAHSAGGFPDDEVDWTYLRQYEKSDPMFAEADLRMTLRLMPSDCDEFWWALSPAMGDYRNAPPCYLYYGEEMLAGNAVLYQRAFQRSGISDKLHIHIEPNMMHGYSCMPVFPESKRAYWETISLIDAL